jgi:putative ABC transport system ATP-binding protein
MALFQKLNQAGMTVIVITHEAEVAQFAGRILRFKDGRIIDEEINHERVDGEALLRDFEPLNQAVEAAS